MADLSLQKIPHSKLCSKCDSLFQSPWTDIWEPLFSSSAETDLDIHGSTKSAARDEYTVEHHMYSELKASAASCNLCRLVFTRFEQQHARGNYIAAILFTAAGAEEEKEAQPLRVAYQVGRGLKFYCKMGSKGWDEHIELLVTDLARMDEAYIQDADWLSNVAFSNYTLQEKNLDLCRKWLSECISSHQKCNQQLLQSTRQLPQRLLEVKYIGTKFSVRLRLTKDFEHVEYMTVSHIWGNLEGPRLTKETLPQFQTQVPLHDLSATFRDAMRITVDLGCNYLWIDALCIIQDDPEDWRSEGLRMSSIYGSSLLNIAASHAIPGSRGCNYSRDPDVIRGVIVRAGEKRLLLTQNMSVYDDLVVLSPLAERAWILQERYLAPRTVYFGKEQIVWECESITSCETFPHGLPPMLRWTSTQTDWIRQEYRSPHKDTVSEWRSIIESYSKSDLTYESDKLIALSGIAKRFAESNGIKNDEYMAGMWRRQLLPTLAWSVRESKRPSTYIAPSWSWASVVGKVAFTDYANESEITSDQEPHFDVSVIDVKVEHKGDTFGDVTGGSLLLECGPLVHVELESEWLTGKASFQFDEPMEKDDGKLFLLEFGELHPDLDDKWVYMLLQFSSDEGDGTFRRVAIGSLAGWIDIKDSLDMRLANAMNARRKFQEAQRDGSYCAATKMYHGILEPNSQGPRYIIRII